MSHTTPNNHVAGTSVYLFASIADQDTIQVNQLHHAIMIAIDNAHKATNKTLTIYVDCPDTEIDERFQATLKALHSAAQSGIQLNIQNAGAPDSTYARVLQSVMDVAQIPTPTNSPFSKYTKQH